MSIQDLVKAAAKASGCEITIKRFQRIQLGA